MKGFTLLEFLIVFCIGAIVLTLAVSGINSIGIDTQQYSAVVIDKKHRAGYYTTTTSTDANGNSRISQTYHPPTWSVIYQTEGERVSCSTSSGKYDRAVIGDKGSIKAGKGRLFGGLVCKGII